MHKNIPDSYSKREWGQPLEFRSLVSAIDGSTLTQHEETGKTYDQRGGGGDTYYSLYMPVHNHGLFTVETLTFGIQENKTYHCFSKEKCLNL